MFDSLNGLLCTESQPLEQQRFVHISNNMQGSGIANPSFLIHHFIRSFLKHGYKVCVVSCLQPLSQYKLILNKLGTNLGQVITDGKFQFISALNLCTGSASPDEKICLCQSADLTSTPHQCSRGEKNFFTEPTLAILEEIKAILGEPGHSSSPGCLIIFDDLTALSDLGVKTSDILNMICRTKALYFSSISTILTSCGRFDSSATCIASCSLSHQLSHWSDLTFDVDQLSSGVCKDVHGQLKVRRRMSSVLGDAEMAYHYKTTDRDLKLFPVGESPAVL